MNSYPPSFRSANFNTLAFNSGGFLTKSQADLLYLPYSSSSYLLLLYGVTEGIVAASKAVIVDSNKDITGFRNLAATNLTGTILTAAQPNITSLGTLTSITTSGTFTMGSTVISAAEIGVIDGVTAGTASASKALVVDSNRDIINIRNLTATQLTGTIQTAAQPNITSLGTLSSSLNINVTAKSCLRLESSNIATLSNSSFTNEFELFLVKAQVASGTTLGISFLQSNADQSITLPSASIISSRFALSSADLRFNTTQVERLRIDYNGIIRFYLNTASTSSTAGAFLLAGGLSISNTTDASSSTNGGTFTTAGGMAIAKKLFVGTDLTANTLTVNNGSTLSTTDGNGNSISNALNVQHLLSSGTAGFGMGVSMSFNMPNSSATIVSYGKIEAESFQVTSGVHQGQLNFYTVIGGAFVKALTLSSLTSSTNNMLELLGATSYFRAYRMDGTIATLSNNLTITNSTLPYLRLTSSSTTGISLINFITDTQNWEMGCRGSASAPNNNLYIYNTQLNLSMTPGGITTFHNTTASTSSTTGSLIVSGGLGIAANSYFSGTIFAGTTSKALCVGTSTDTTRLISALDSALANGSTDYICFGHSNATNNQAELCFNYTSTGSSSNRFEIGFAGTNRLFTLNAAGLMRINNPVSTLSTGTVQIQSSGYCLNLIQSATYYSRVGTDASGNFIVETNTAGGSGGTYQHYLLAGNLGLGNRSPSSFRLDFGNVGANFIVAIYNFDNLSPTYGIGAADACLKFHSGGTNGFRFYINSTGGVGAPTTQGTEFCRIDPFGITLPARIFMTNEGYGYSHLSGSGVEVVTRAIGNVSGSIGTIGSHPFYLRTADTIRLTVAANGSVGIGLTPTYLLDVSHNTQTLATAYAYYLSNDTSGTGTNTGAVNFSARFSGRIAVAAEIDVYSDYRIKSNIVDLTDDYVDKFMSLKAKHYTKTTTNSEEIGFIAQDVVKKELNELYTLHHTVIDELIEDDGFVNPKDQIFTLNYINMIPILHRKIQMLEERILFLEQESLNNNNKH